MTTEIPKPPGSTWSDDQWRAISLSGGDMLVAAAAGSGKTAVLVERIIRKLTDRRQPLSVDRLLVATFTKAAAAEMRQRITEALEKELGKDPGNEHLSRQLAMLGRAAITTLHSFCMEVIQRYYTLIPLDPGFRIASESETALLRQEVLENLFEEKYAAEQAGSDFLRLVDWFGGERSDDAVFALVQRLYDFSRSHPWPEVWLRRAAEVFLAPDTASLEVTVWVKSIMADTVLTLAGAEELLRQAKALALAPGGPQPYAATLEDDLNLIGNLQSAVESGPWSKLHEAFRGAAFGKLKSCKKDQTDPVMQERVKSLREEAKKTVTDLRTQLYGRSPEQFLDEMHRAAPLLVELSSLTIRFGELYRREKVAKGWLDFSDLEHYCLQILRHPDATPKEIRPSDAALEYRLQFDEVLLDEYQDTNTVQENIVRLISRDAPGNRFMVGDVKQSIYRFRLAEPGLFLEKYKKYGDDFGGEGLRIDLARNFRSRREVVDAVNLLFRQIMNESVAEISYDSRAELAYGEGFPAAEGDDYRPELLLIDRGANASEAAEETGGGFDGPGDNGADGPASAEVDEDEAALLETVRLEARVIAARIRRMLGEGGRPLRVYDKRLQAMRPVAYGDIVILLRSTLTWAPAMIEELRQEGVPAFGELSQGYFQASEVETMLSLLQIIDNPLQDIPLAAVLRSPLYSYTEEELAEIRLASPGGRFYEAVMALAAKEENLSLAAKLKTFLRQLDLWRSAASEGDLGSLIRSIYRETGYLEWVGGLPGGVQRQGNLIALLDRARQYEVSSSSPGLFRFLRHVTRLRENGGDLGAAPAAGEQGDAVRIMTIHKSKGLEFPVVFVAGLSKMFNRQDLNVPFLMHKEMGFGPKYIDLESRVSYPTLPNLAIRRRAQMELIAEEMRVLYVALTRPKDKLVLVSAVKNLSRSAETWGKALETAGDKLPDYMLARGRCYLDWIGPALIRHRSAAGLRRFSGLPEASPAIFADNTSDWSIEYISSREISQSVGVEAALAKEQPAFEAAALKAIPPGRPVPALTVDGFDSDISDKVASRLSWRYSFEAASRISAKTSVTEMKAALAMQEQPANDVFTQEELRKEREAPEGQAEFKLHLRRPRFIEQRKLTGAERGTAYHTVMQHLPLESEPDEKAVKATLAGLVERQIMTPEQAAEMDPARIAGFMASSIGDLLRRADWIKREMPFSYGLSAAEAYPQFAESAIYDRKSALDTELFRELYGETVLIQGIIDCLFSVDGKIYLLDYKSDRVLGHSGGVEALAKSYRFQLELYADAVEHIMGVPVEDKWLYFFDSGDAVKL